jgi:hypothetical protein
MEHILLDREEAAPEIKGCFYFHLSSFHLWCAIVKRLFSFHLRLAFTFSASAESFLTPFFTDGVPGRIGKLGYPFSPHNSSYV